MDDHTLMERMKRRRRAMENTMMSDVTYDDNIEDRTMAHFPSQNTMLDTDVPTIIESLGDKVEDLDDNEGSMMEALQTRREQKQRELEADAKAMTGTSAQADTLGWASSTPIGGKGMSRMTQKPPLPRMVTSEALDGEQNNSAALDDTALGMAQAEGKSQLSSTDKSQRRIGGDVNLNASIRERMRNKVKGLHGKSESPAQDEMNDRKLRGLRDRPLPSRFDESPAQIPSFGDEAVAQLHASLQTAKQWKKARAKAKATVGFPTEDEAFDFFVGNIEEQPEEEKQEAAPQPGGGQNEEATVVDVFEDTSLLQWLKPEYTPHREQLVAEYQLYGYPSILAAPKEDKIPRGAVPRSLEDEGLYVGKPPPASQGAVNRVENRILLAKKAKYFWFGKDGNLVRLPNPLREKSTRLPPPREDFETLMTEWGKPEIGIMDSKYIDSATGKHYQIDVDVSSITFTHHPLFSREHVLAVKLQQLYNHYYLRRNRGLKEHLIDKLQALRLALKQVQEGTIGKVANVKGKVHPRANAACSLEYRKEIRQVRKQRDDEDFKDETLLKNMLNCWRSIKRVREGQGYINTPITLKIRRQVTNKEEEEAELLIDVEEEMNELREEYDEGYREKYAEYELKMLEWKKQMKLMKRKRQRLLEQSQRDPSLAAELEDEVKPVRPEAPTSFDEEAARLKIYERLDRKLRKPGQPIFIPELQNVANVTLTEQCPRSEQLRRADIKSAKYYIRVLFNDVEVSRTATRPLTSEFTIHFGEILSIRILQRPESLKFQLVDSSSWPHSQLADLYTPIPEMSMVSGAVDLEHLEFSCDHVVTCKHDGVGSGVTVYFGLSSDPDAEPPVTVLTSGILYTCTAWAVDDLGNPMAPPSHQTASNALQSQARQHDALVALGAAGMVDINRLLAWLDKTKFDPNDPANANIIDILRYAHVQRGTVAPEYFRLNQLENETDFATDKDLDSNKRFRLIRLREQGVPEFRNMKMIPIDDKYIKDTTFDAYEKRLEGEQEEVLEPGRETHRAMIARFLTQVRQEVLARTQVAQSRLDVKDVVIEDEVPDIGTLGQRIGELFAPRRPLKPTRKERKRVGGQNLATVKDATVLINIVRAFDVPVRSETTKEPSVRPRGPTRPDQSLSSSRGANMFSASGRGPQPGYPSSMAAQSAPQAPHPIGPVLSFETLVSPFVEVTFQGQVARTSVADGPVPNWNEDLVLPFRPPNNDYSAENLQTVTDKIFIHLYDEIRIDTLEDERQRGTVIHQRIEKYWLGGVEIPFSTVYFNSKVEGFLHIVTPPVLLGYEKSHASKLLGFSAVRNEAVSIKGHTYLQAFITLEPQMQPPKPVAEVFDTSEDDTLVHNSQVWLNSLRKQFPDRQYKTLVSDLSGKKVFVTRYIRAQRPPDALISDSTMPAKQAMRLLARFVSLIPYISDSVQFPDLCDIWTNSEQFLRMLAGDEEEHAILLCNYFLHMKIETWVTLGYGIPEGSTAYVLTREGTSFLLWNPVTAEYYNIGDQRCPLQSVGCLINEHNIYANVQKTGKPCNLMMALHDPKYWRPFFDKGYPNPGLGSIQVENPTYYPLDHQLATDLQDRIERHLRDAFMDWRPRAITRWNRYTNQVFRSLLQNIEPKVAMGIKPDDHRAELEQVLSSSKLTGFPIQMPFTDIQTITEAVKSTGVHHCDNPNAEFALAVHIHPYPNSVMVVWVYLGIIAKRGNTL